MRTFDLGDVLSVTTGRLVSRRGVDAMYDLLGYMTGDTLWTHQLPRAWEECSPALLAQHPDLADVPVPDEFDGEEHVWRWLAEQVTRYGKSREVRPLDPADHTSIDPLAELRMMRPDLPVIAVELPEPS
jgi:hypothetical protein